MQHIRVAPYHPSSNGLAERAVQIFKQGMKKVTEGTVYDRIARFLFQYRITLHTTTGLPPCEMLMERKLCSGLDLLRPDVQASVIQKQAKQKSDRDKHCKPRCFSEGEKVFAKNFRKGKKWLPGHTVRKKGPVSFEIELQNGQTCHRHQNHVRSRATTDVKKESEENIWLADVDDDDQSDPEPNVEPENSVGSDSSGRYPSRVRRPPHRFGH